jgi:hypothetical protein
LLVVPLGLLRGEHKELVERRRWMEESAEVYLNINSECGGAGGMKDVEASIIVHDQGVLREGFGAVRALFAQALNPCCDPVFVVHNEHMPVLLSSELLWSAICSTGKCREQQ